MIIQRITSKKMLLLTIFLSILTLMGTSSTIATVNPIVSCKIGDTTELVAMVLSVTSNNDKSSLEEKKMRILSETPFEINISVGDKQSFTVEALPGFDERYPSSGIIHRYLLVSDTNYKKDLGNTSSKWNLLGNPFIFTDWDGINEALSDYEQHLKHNAAYEDVEVSTSDMDDDFTIHISYTYSRKGNLVQHYPNGSSSTTTIDYKVDYLLNLAYNINIGNLLYFEISKKTNGYPDSFGGDYSVHFIASAPGYNFPKAGFLSFNPSSLFFSIPLFLFIYTKRRQNQQ